jgi:hypothetical protein
LSSSAALYYSHGVVVRSLVDEDVLAHQLTAEHGHVVPASLIRTAIETVSASPVRDPLDAERIARADVAALAAAARRRGDR